MALATRLELRQGQQLVMTPQLQQAIRLLQLSNFELAQYVESELERNPLLERDESSEASMESEDREPAAEANGSSSEHALDLEGGVVDAGATLDTEYDNVYPDTPQADMDRDASLGNWSTVRQRNHNGFDDDTNLEDYVAGETSLKDHLSTQLPLALQAPAERLVGQYLIDLVDEAGYLTANLAEIAERLGAPASLVEKVLATLQTFDPVGVFARSLGECLALQLKERNRYDPQIASLLDNLHLLAQHNVAALRRAVGVEMDELAEMVSEIKRLDPKPGLRFGHVEVQAIVPDVLVRAAADGSWIVELNSETLPRVLVNRSYYSRVSRTAHTEKDKDYLIECLQTANWLVKSLDQRARTILKVAEEIVRQQDGFLTHGVENLRPLNLKKVADAISMHESTVSRVTSNKYMATPRGIFELKYFFTSSIASSEDEGEAHSSEAVRHRIKQLIEAESAADVLSDDRIVDILKGTGIDIARRTVAKYREALRIPSSVQRRREKRLSEQVGRVM